MTFSQNPSSALLAYVDTLPSANPLLNRMNEWFASDCLGFALLGSVWILN